MERNINLPKFPPPTLPCLQDFSEFSKAAGAKYPDPSKHRFSILYDKKRYPGLHPWSHAFRLKIQNYLDDYMGYHRNAVTSLHQMNTVLKVLVWLGVDVGLAKKIFGPACHQVLTGYLLDTVSFTIVLKPGKPGKIQKRIKVLLECSDPPIRLLQQVAGDMAWAAKVLPGSLALANPLHCVITLMVDKEWKSFPTSKPELRPLYKEMVTGISEFLLILNSEYKHRINHLQKTTPWVKRSGFFDASGDWGIGGTWGPRFFWQLSHKALFTQYISHDKASLSRFKAFVSSHSTHAELLACAVSLDIGLQLIPLQAIKNRVLKITTDNQALAWLVNGCKGFTYPWNRLLTERCFFCSGF